MSNPFYFTPAAGQTATGNCANVCSGIQVKGKCPTFELALSNTTTPSATVLIYGYVSGLGLGTLLGTLTASGALACDSFTPQFGVSYTSYSANVQAIAGTLAVATVSVGF